jgi:uncharacterized Zn finger protein
MQMPIPNLSEAVIRRESTAQSFERGREYHYSAAVFGVIRRGDQIVAQVAGSHASRDPYTVSVDFDREGIVDAACDCPYDWGGWCKHIVAALLVCLHEPERIEAKSSIEALLAGLDRAQLHDILLRLVEDDPGLIESIEREVATIRPGTAAPPSQRVTIDQASIRRQVHAILHSLDHMRRSEAYWHVARVVGQVRHMLARVRDWIDDGEIGDAFAFLEAITDAYVADWAILDDSNGDPSGFFADLGNAWENAALTAGPSLSPAERKEWVRKLIAWQEQLHGYELDEAFEFARMELEEDAVGSH